MTLAVPDDVRDDEPDCDCPPGWQHDLNCPFVREDDEDEA